MFMLLIFCGLPVSARCLKRKTSLQPRLCEIFIWALIFFRSATEWKKSLSFFGSSSNFGRLCSKKGPRPCSPLVADPYYVFKVVCINVLLNFRFIPLCLIVVCKKVGAGFIFYMLDFIFEKF